MKAARLSRWFLALVCAVVFAAADGAEVHVMISAGFYQAYSEVVTVFERSSGHRVVTTRGPSLGDSTEAIPNRLKRGESADVVIAVAASIDDLARQGLLRAETKVDFARSQIGMVVRAGSRKPDISNVDALRRTLLEAKSIAYSDSSSGIYLSTVLFARLGVAEQLAGKSKKVRGPPSGEPVAAVVARGEAEIGFQQVSELIHEPGVDFVGPIPAELQQDTRFSGALTSRGREIEAAEALIRFLASEQAAGAITKAGLSPMSRP